MLTMFSGRERTFREYSALARASGWELTRVRRNPGGLWAYFTAVPV